METHFPLAVFVSPKRCVSPKRQDMARRLFKMVIVLFIFLRYGFFPPCVIFISMLFCM